MQYSGGGNGSLIDVKPCGPGIVSPEVMRKVEREAPGDESGGIDWRGKALDGRNPMSVSGTKQGHRHSRGSNPQEPEKGWRGMASGWNQTLADSRGLERWRGGEAQGRRFEAHRSFGNGTWRGSVSQGL